MHTVKTTLLIQITAISFDNDLIVLVMCCHILIIIITYYMIYTDLYRPLCICMTMEDDTYFLLRTSYILL